MYRKIIYLSILILSIGACTPDENLVDNSPKDDRDPFIASWQCKENSKLNGSTTFTVQISKDETYENIVKIANFYLFGYDDLATANVTGKIIRIPKQTFCNHQIQGEGYIDNSGTTINWEYTVDDGSAIDSCTAIYIKK